jgi:hypothetical protein
MLSLVASMAFLLGYGNLHALWRFGLDDLIPPSRVSKNRSQERFLFFFFFFLPPQIPTIQRIPHFLLTTHALHQTLVRLRFSHSGLASTYMLIYSIMRCTLDSARSRSLRGTWYSLRRPKAKGSSLAVIQPYAVFRLVSDFACVDSCNADLTSAICNARSTFVHFEI